MEPYFGKDITDRQAEITGFFLGNLGCDPDRMHYIKTEEYFADLYAIDVAVYEPTKYFDYYVATTVGLSDYRFNKNFARSELIMILPKNWKPIFDKEEYYWPLQILLDCAYGLVQNKMGGAYGQVLLPRENDTPYTSYSDAIGGITVVPEMLPVELYNAEVEGEFVWFLQVVPISKNDLEKIELVGLNKFVEFDLHDSEGPQMVVKLQEKPLFGIDKIIKQNEDILKNKKNN